MEENLTQKETSLHNAGQRQINRIWEFTQAFIAITVSGSTLYVSSHMALNNELGSFALLSNAFFLVIGFYFGRTNHQRLGKSREH